MQGEITANGLIVGGMIGQRGAPGVGIKKIEKTGTSGLIDTYTITYTNGTTFQYEVANGEKGDTGNGITKIEKTGTLGLVDTYTITYDNGTTTTYEVTNGEKGETGATPDFSIGSVTKGDDAEATITGTAEEPILNLVLPAGNGISSIEKTGTAGLVDTYTIRFTDETTFTYNVTNGADGNVTDVLVDDMSVVDNGKAYISTEWIYNALPKVSESDVETATLDNSVDKAPLKSKLKGNTSQYSTTGKQLIPKATKMSGSATNPQTFSGITFTNVGSGHFYLKGTATAQADILIFRQSNEGESITVPAGTYTFSSPSLPSGVKVITSGGGGNGFVYSELTSTNLSATSNVTDGTQPFNYIDIRVANGTNLSNGIDIYFMLESGSTAHDWEPYTNGASPNPDYPQPINVVSGDNEVVVCGINFWDEQWELGTFNTTTGANNSSTTQIRSKNLIDIFSNTLYYFNNPTSSNIGYWIMFYDKEGNIITGYTPSTNNSTSGNCFKCDTNKPTIVTPPNAKKMKFYLTVDYGATYNNDICINISNASINGHYYPYQSQTYPINLGELELCNIGDYQDYFTKNSEGQWCKYNAIGKVVLDGSEANWGKHSSSTGTNYRYWLNDVNFQNVFTNCLVADETILKDNVLCNEFKGVTFSNTSYGKFSMHNLTSSNCFFLVNLDDTTITSVAEYKTWLGTHNEIVYYPLATPYLSLIEDTTLIEQLNTIEKAYSYDTQTNISQENNDKPFKIDVETIQKIAGE